DVENPRGRIRVTGWDRPEVRVRATKQPDSSWVRFNATRIESRQDGNAVFLRTIVDPSGQFGDQATLQEVAAEMIRAVAELIRNHNQPAAVEYDVQVPFQAMLDLQGVSGDVVVEGVQGSVRAATVSGVGSVVNARGDLGLRTVSGDIDGRDLSGRLDVESVSGNVRVAGQFDTLRAKNVSGVLEVAGPFAQTG